MSAPAKSPWTDLFVRRPVLGVALATLVTVLGIFGLAQLQVREYPNLTATQITVSTSYPGANPQTVQSYITQPLGRVLGSVPGLDYMTSSSAQGTSTLTLNMRLNTNPDSALTNVLTKVKEVEALLPQHSFPPVVNASAGHSIALMYISFYSPGGKMPTPKIVDYVVRNIQPLLQTVNGVSEARIIPGGASGGNGNNQAMRIWLDPTSMAAHDVTPSDVASALAAQNVVAATGSTKGNLISIPLSSNLGLTRADQFGSLIVATRNGVPIHLDDVAKVEMGGQSYNSSFFFDGKPGVAVAISLNPSANALAVARDVDQRLAGIRDQLPAGLKMGLPYNAATFIKQAISEVAMTVGLTLAAVVLVIFLFLGSLRSLVIPAVAIPLSLAGAGFLMYLAGYSYNLITLLAIVLAIGLVVDDAIVVVENVHRHIEDGRSGFQAAILSARELTLPIIVMSTTLVAVFLPVLFSGGLTGTLFKEFAYTIIFAVLISMLVALTLSPMMSGKLLRKTPTHGLNHALNAGFDRLSRVFDRSLRSFLAYPLAGVPFIVITFFALFLMVTTVRQELAPPQNSGVLFSMGNAAPTAAPGYMDAEGHLILKQFDTIKEKAHSFMVTGFSPAGGPGTNSLIAGITLKPFSERTRTATDLKPELQQKLSSIPGVKAGVFIPPPLPGASGFFPVDVSITGPTDYDKLDKIADEVMGAARKSHKFMFIQKTLKIDQPQRKLVINRKLASQLGIGMNEIAANLRPLLSGGYVNRFTMEGYAYQVIPQAPDSVRATTRKLAQTQIRTASGKLVPLSSLAHFETQVVPENLPQFDRLNSVGLQGVPFPGVSQGEALGFLAQALHQVAPGARLEYSGASRQFIQEGHGAVMSLVLALALLYLLLSAQFNSFRDALVVMFSVPMSAAGALIFMTLGMASMNIYTKIALITLIGLIAKQGILVVQFANVLQQSEGLGKLEAVQKAASIRLRPILMTTLSMVFGVIPLIMATGSGAPPRHEMGIVIAAGLGIGALFSLYIVPLMYLFLGRDLAKSKGREADRDREVAMLETRADHY